MSIKKRKKKKKQTNLKSLNNDNGSLISLNVFISLSSQLVLKTHVQVKFNYERHSVNQIYVLSSTLEKKKTKTNQLNNMCMVHVGCHVWM